MSTHPKRAKFATLSTTVKEEVVPLLIHDPNAGPGEPQYTYATFANVDEAEAAVASLTERGNTATQEVIIDGRAVTIQHLVTEDDPEDPDNAVVEEVEAIEEGDEEGSHTILHILPSTSSIDDNVIETEAEEGELIDADISVTIETGEDEDIDESLSPADMGLRSKTFYCPNCGNCYSAAGSLKLHMRACLKQRHEVPAEERKCEICNKVFNSVSYLKEHMMRHAGQGPRRCSRCYRKFVDEEKFKAHLEAHKQQDRLDLEAEELAAQHGGKKVVVKAFTCSFCSQSFTVVFEAGQVKRRYACDTCREKYSNADMLKRHKEMIDEKREYPCERCGRKFVFEGFLQRHLPTCDGTIKRRRDMK